jgi:hypothetical protein
MFGRWTLQQDVPSKGVWISVGSLRHMHEVLSSRLGGHAGGGLLLSVPSHCAPACVKSLIRSGFDKATVIGQIIQPSGDKVIRVLCDPYEDCNGTQG